MCATATSHRVLVDLPRDGGVNAPEVEELVLGVLHLRGRGRGWVSACLPPPPAAKCEEAASRVAAAATPVVVVALWSALKKAMQI